uniref:ZP domain-containing protein n=1 Tax=Romanomermis culicivorax TaxID=13658 RepID=A0A915ILF4_ROMCU
MFEMLVHSCVVDNGKAQDGQEVLDKKGCPVDPLILGPLTYNTKGNVAYVDVQAFKFPDESVVYYQCSVSLCMKGDNGCDKLSPPICGTSAQGTRLKRMVESGYNSSEHGSLETFDVSNTLTIFDLDEVASLTGCTLFWCGCGRGIEEGGRMINNTKNNYQFIQALGTTYILLGIFGLFSTLTTAILIMNKKLRNPSYIFMNASWQCSLTLFDLKRNSYSCSHQANYCVHVSRKTRPDDSSGRSICPMFGGREAVLIVAAAAAVLIIAAAATLEVNQKLRKMT